MSTNETRHIEAAGFVLTACADPALLRTDRDVLRAAGEDNVRARLSGESALEFARRSAPKLVVCDLELGDMRAPEFIRALRETPFPPPVMTVSADRSRATMLDCIAAGCAGYVLRPYSLGAFSRQLAAAQKGVDLMKLAKARIEKLQAEEERERTLRREAEKNRPEHFYRRGLKHLALGLYDDAILSFTRAVSLQSLFAEAYVGLARAWKAKGRPDKFAAFMSKAAQAYAKLDRFHEAREMFIDVLKDNPGAENPFLELGFKMIKRGEFEDAARAYHQAEAFKPGTDIYRELARACHFTGNPLQSARNVAEHLAAQPDRPEASGVYERIMGGPWRPKKDPAAAPLESGFTAPTRLHEFWLVVKFTWQVYRNGGALAAGG